MQPVDWHKRFSEQAGWTASARNYLFSRTGLQADALVLEVGCGTGAVLEDASNRFTNLIHGLDINWQYLSLAQGILPTALLTCGDALLLPYQNDSFDACFFHFFLMWVDTAAAMHEMMRVTRPGGWILALAEPDYGGRIDFPEELSEIGRLQSESLRRQGANPNTGRQLASLFHRAGLDDIHTGVIGGEWTRVREPAILDNEWRVIQDDLHDLASKNQLASWYQLDRAASTNGSRVLYVPVFYALGKVPQT
jgi:SAM-dependent methyltransferase